VRARLEDLPVGDVAVSSVTVSELWYGVDKSAKRERNAEALRKFLLPLVVLSYDESAAEWYGRIRADLERKGTPVGGMDDMMIAAHGLAAGLTVVTNNVAEFQRVTGLRIEDWCQHRDGAGG
jgi:tRNA(fMet)-specific endonuclease VapC